MSTDELQEEATHFTIGQSTGCDLKITHSSVSRAHLRVFYTDNEVLLEDLSSESGTFVYYKGEYKRVKKAKIKMETMIRIGDVLEPMPVKEVIKSFELIKKKADKDIVKRIKPSDFKRCGDCGSVISISKIFCNTCGAVLEECA